MKEHDINLTLQETEQLCRLYMDCRLSVVEETELQYVLGKLSYRSPIIDEARLLMGLEIMGAAQYPTAGRPSGKRGRGLKLIARIAAAASVIAVLGIGVVSYRNSYGGNGNGEVACVVFSNGKEWDEEHSLRQVEADMRKADAFINHVAMLDAEQTHRIEEFINHQSF